MRDNFTVWLTGLSGSGKSTLAQIIERRLHSCGARVEILDGDVVRARLAHGLGFGKGDRNQNVRQLGFVCELLNRHGVIALVAAISPYREIREEVKSMIPRFVEVHVDCRMDVLIKRDTKGLYKKALAGEITGFTGISDPYEPPVDAVLRIDTSAETPEESADRIWLALSRFGLVSQEQVGCVAAKMGTAVSHG